jgi:predicted ribosomally synthesized peptide with nif11-like leader
MSLGAAMAFIDRVESDPELEAKLTPNMTVEELLKVAAEAGFVFTAVEYKLACSSADQTLADSVLTKIISGFVDIDKRARRD